jgi:hypothetical protein
MTPDEIVRITEAYRIWNSTAYSIRVALVTNDIAAYNTAQSERQTALAKLEQIEQAALCLHY